MPGWTTIPALMTRACAASGDLGIVRMNQTTKLGAGLAMAGPALFISGRRAGPVGRAQINSLLGMGRPL